MSQSNLLVSPTRPGAASAQTLAVPYSSTDDFRSSFRYDLTKAVQYDNEAVLDKLLASDSPDSWRPASCDKTATAVLAAVEAACAHNLVEIRTVAMLEDADEERLYEPLNRICATIEKTIVTRLEPESRFMSRQVIFTGEHPLRLDDRAFPDSGRIKPDFVIADVPPPASPGMATAPYPSANLLWRQCVAFMEVKPKASDSATKGKNIFQERQANKTLVQGADYARFLLVSHPFNLFTYGVFVSGDQFCVGLFDRCGIVLSPDYTLAVGNDGLRKFVRVIARLVFEMSPHDVGQDPTVRMLPPYVPYGMPYPRYRVGMGPSTDSRVWVTYGPPLWVSHTLLGRGTAVWRVTEQPARPNGVAILKVAWRSSGRKPETAICEDIVALLRSKGLGCPDSVAIPYTGGDVHESEGRAITVTRLRGPVPPPTERNGVSDRVLHRIAVRRFGKPLWEYSSVEQFVRAMICVLEAHKDLSDNEILHRDISGGNILIDVKPNNVMDEDYVPEDYPVEHTRAFLTDFELASVPLLPEQDRVYRVPVDPSHVDHPMGTTVSGHVKSRLASHSRFDSIREQTPPKSRAGDGMTGTVIFMSQRILEAAINNESVVRTAEDDLESFGWVIFYAIYRHGLQDEEGLKRMKTQLAKEAKEAKKNTSLSMNVVRNNFRKEFGNIFSVTSLSELHTKRAALLGRQNPASRSLPYLWKYARDCEADGYGLCLAGLITVVWALLKRFQLSEKNYKLHDNPYMAVWDERAEQIEAGGGPVVRDSSPAKPLHDDFLANLNLAMKQISEFKANLAKATMSK